MDSSKEKIEAQLCEYFEGELDEANRAEIERHLQTNPQHRALMAELRQQRELLQTLPRATIPGDLNENLTGQLERSALLSDDDETAEAGVRINRWPQFTAIAAVLVLAVGLGLVVYYVLPAGTRHGPMAAMVAKSDNATAPRQPASEPVSVEKLAEKQSNATTTPSLGRSDTLASAADGMSRGRAVSSDLPAAAPAAAAPAISSTNEKNKPAASSALGTAAADPKSILRDVTSGPGLVTPAEVEELQRRMTHTLGGEANAAFHLDPRNSLYLVVQTKDPVAANGQVSAYFKSNNIQYMNAAADLVEFGSTPAALAQAQDTDKAADLRPGTGAYGGGVSSINRLEARGYSLEPGQLSGGRGGGGGFGGAAGAGPSGGAAGGAQAKAGSADAGGTYGRGAQPESARRSITREPGAPAAAASQPYVALNGSGSAAIPVGADAQAALQQKAKLDGSAARSERASESAPLKDALSLNARSRPAPAEATKRESLSAGASPQAGQEALTGRDRSAPGGPVGASTWEMRRGLPTAGERPAVPGGVIVARMNRRQAGELGTILSRDGGQRAELRDFAGFNNTVTGVPAAEPTAALGDAVDRAKTPAIVTGKPSTGDRGEPAKKESAPAAPTDETFRLAPKPQDEPVDVVIVLKSTTAAATPPAAAAKPETDSKK